MKRKHKQAVVIIHGIGEQRPVDTLREFMNAIETYLKEKKKVSPQFYDKNIYWSKPDFVSESYETRRMVLKSGAHHDLTDFFELYWAHHFRETKWSHIRSWLMRLVFRAPNQIPTRLKSVFYFLWGLFVSVGLIFLFSCCFLGAEKTIGSLLSYSTGIVGAIILGIFSYFLFNYLGDAARYMDPSPGNVDERQKIRFQGVSLLKKLHESNSYDRIIIVAHSLGTVVAYDLIKFLWAEYYRSIHIETFSKLTKQSHYKRVFTLIKSSEEEARLIKPKDGKSISKFQQKQAESFEYLKAIGNKWLITDLITLGSPLAHASYLFVPDKKIFDDLKSRREYPTCSPTIEPPDKSNIIRSKDRTGDHPYDYFHFNHSSPFSVVRWKNIYNQGDFIGGDISEAFGDGISNIPKGVKKWWHNLLPLDHTRYWDTKYQHNSIAEIWSVFEQRRFNLQKFIKKETIATQEQTKQEEVVS